MKYDSWSICSLGKKQEKCQHVPTCAQQRRCQSSYGGTFQRYHLDEWDKSRLEAWPRLKPREKAAPQWPNDRPHPPAVHCSQSRTQGLFSGAQSVSIGENPWCCYGASILSRRPQTTKVNGSRNLEYWSDTPPLWHSQSAQVHVPCVRKALTPPMCMIFQEVIQTKHSLQWTFVASN